VRTHVADARGGFNLLVANRAIFLLGASAAVHANQVVTLVGQPSARSPCFPLSSMHLFRINQFTCALRFLDKVTNEAGRANQLNCELLPLAHTPEKSVHSAPELVRTSASRRHCSPLRNVSLGPLNCRTRGAWRRRTGNNPRWRRRTAANVGST
jgi:hypothetical protein